MGIGFPGARIMAEQQSCSIDGFRIAFQQAGAGEPLLLVHGITTYSFIWRKLIPLLAPSFQVIAVDLLGCGASDKPLDQSYSLKVHARRLVTFCQALQLEAPHFIGHDLGGGIGQIVAVRHPGKIRSLTLINSVGHNFWPVQPISIMRTPIVRQFLMSIVDRRLFRLIVLRGLYHPERLTDELMDLFWEPFRSTVGRKAFLHFAKCLDNHDLTELENELRQLRLPVQILRGDADPYLSAVISEKLQRDIPGSRLRRIPTASHFLMEDEPEWAARQIVDFLQGRHESR
jgi:pimeloyl-ACP methyl ester carboxylesterase